MTYDYKAALDELTMAIAKDSQTPKKIKRDAFTTHTLLKNIFTIMEALTIAAEYERVCKERDELARGIMCFLDYGDIGETDEQCELVETIAKKVRNENGNA